MSRATNRFEVGLAVLEDGDDLRGGSSGGGHLARHLGEEPSPIEAEPESTTWISRSGSWSRAIVADLIAAESVPADIDADDRVGTPGELALEDPLEVARAGGGGLGERRVGRDHALPELFGRAG